MDYTEITKETVRERDRACRGILNTSTIRTPSNKPQFANKTGKPLHTGNSITYFCKNMLGVNPYSWQHQFFEDVLANDKDVYACTPRQVGKSFAVGVAAIHAIVHNLYPIRSKGGKTVIGIVSKSLDQSKHLMKGIRELMYMGDAYLNEYHPDEFGDYFDKRVSRMRVDTNNKTAITFREPIKNSKGEWEARGAYIGEIVCIPPTDSARGYTFSKLFMDEAAFFEDDDFFSTVAEPTLRATGGRSVITTTPNGQKGWFFNAFDPFDENYKVNPYYRLWLHWTHIENEAEREAVVRKKKKAEAEGSEKKFMQEYEASFIVDSTSFFDPEKVDAMFDADLAPWDSYTKPTDLGIDVGFKRSRTVITISRLGEDGTIYRIWHHVYPEADDLPIVQDVLALIPKYNIQRVIIDDCAAASAIIQKLTKEGVNLKLMSFKKYKTSKYVQFKAKMYQGLIRSYKDKDLSVEMKGLVETEGLRMTRIEKLKNYTDDIIDSLVISTFFFVEEKKGLKMYDWDDLE